jgi:hypothetical protein
LAEGDELARSPSSPRTPRRESLPHGLHVLGERGAEHFTGEVLQRIILSGAGSLVCNGG